MTASGTFISKFSGILLNNTLLLEQLTIEKNKIIKRKYFFKSKTINNYNICTHNYEIYIVLINIIFFKLYLFY